MTISRQEAAQRALQLINLYLEGTPEHFGECWDELDGQADRNRTGMSREDYINSMLVSHEQTYEDVMSAVIADGKRQKLKQKIEKAWELAKIGKGGK